MVKKPPKAIPGKSLIRKLRKPLAPPTRVSDDEKKYQRSREQERIRREIDLPKVKE